MGGKRFLIAEDECINLCEGTLPLSHSYGFLLPLQRNLTQVCTVSIFVFYWYLIQCYFCLAFQDVVSRNCVVIFSKTTCPYCKMAKNVFNEIGATYKVIELDEHNDGRRLQEALAQMTGARTVTAPRCALGTVVWYNCCAVVSPWKLVSLHHHPSQNDIPTSGLLLKTLSFT